MGQWLRQRFSEIHQFGHGAAPAWSSAGIRGAYRFNVSMRVDLALRLFNDGTTSSSECLCRRVEGCQRTRE